MAQTNNAPKTHWHRLEMACGTVRHRLFIDGRETPYFVDDARKAGIGHWTEGDPVALFGSGMGRVVRRIDGDSYRIAATLQTFRNVSLAKARAQVIAFS